MVNAAQYVTMVFESLISQLKVEQRTITAYLLMFNGQEPPALDPNIVSFLNLGRNWGQLGSKCCGDTRIATLRKISRTKITNTIFLLSSS